MDKEKFNQILQPVDSNMGGEVTRELFYGCSVIVIILYVNKIIYYYKLSIYLYK